MLLLILLIIASSLFFLTHLVLSHGFIREAMIEQLSELGFRAVYSLVAFLTLGLAILMMMKVQDMGPVFWDSTWLYPLTYLLMMLAFTLTLLALANPSPTGMMPAAMEPRGVLRVTRHPMNMGIASFALAHLIANGSLGGLFFFGAIFLTGFVGAYHQDRRKAREKGDEFRTFQEQTSVLPFAAIINGKTRLAIKEFSLPLLVIAAAAYVAMIFLHQRLIGVTPF